MMKEFNKNGLNFSAVRQIKKNVLPTEVAAEKPAEDLSTITDIINLLIKSIYHLESIKSAENNKFNNLPKYDLPLEEADFNDSVRFYKINLIKNALRKSKGRQNKAAKLLNLKNSTLNAIIKKYEIYL